MEEKLIVHLQCIYWVELDTSGSIQDSPGEQFVHTKFYDLMVLIINLFCFIYLISLAYCMYRDSF